MMVNNWSQIMYQYHRGCGVVAQFYFISTIFVLNIILLNLFLALILESFDNPTKLNDDSDDKEVSGLKSFQVKFIRAIFKIFERLPWLEKKLEANHKLKQLESFLT